MGLKRILYAAHLWAGSSCVPRLHGLQTLGLDVVALDTTPWFTGPYRLVNSIAQRLYITPGVWAMNATLLRETARVRPEVVWLDRATWVYPYTLRRLREFAPYMVHYNTDDVFDLHSYFWLHRLGLKHYDLYLTTNRANVLELRKRLDNRIFRVGMGYDQGIHFPPPMGSQERLKYDVVFVGHWEPHTERYVVALRGSGIAVGVWGHNWWKAQDPTLRKAKPLPLGEYVRTIASARIALCSLSRRNRNESTGRSFEIPAIGTFMLAERTAEHEFICGDGVGAALFSGEEELVDKARYYLEHEAKRKQIAAKGHELSATLGVSWGDHIRREWPIAERWLLNKESCFCAADDKPFWPEFRNGKAWNGLDR